MVEKPRSGVKVRSHGWVWNHYGSAKITESEAEIQAIKEMASQGTPVNIIEGYGENSDCSS
jgi:phage protein U